MLVGTTYWYDNRVNRLTLERLVTGMVRRGRRGIEGSE